MSEFSMDDFTAKLAEEITSTWSSFNRSPTREAHKKRLQTAIGAAIVKELIIANSSERRGEGAKW